MGWIGMIDQVMFYLSTVGADKDIDGKFLITGTPITFGLDGAEVVIPDETNYLVDGKPKALAAGLCSTSYGLKVKVIG